MEGVVVCCLYKCFINFVFSTYKWKMSDLLPLLLMVNASFKKKQKNIVHENVSLVLLSV